MTAPTITRNVLHGLNHEGDTKTMWDPENEDEIQVAREMFNSLKKRGYLAYTVEDDGEQGEVIREFDETAGKIIMVPQPVGG